MATRVDEKFFRVQAGYEDDEALWGVSDRAELLYVRGISYCKKKGTDGFIPTNAIHRVAIRIQADFEALAAELVAVGLWIAEPEGWRVRTYAKWQMTTDEVEAKKRVARGKALRRYHGEGKHDQEPVEDCPLCPSMQTAPSGDAGSMPDAGRNGTDKDVDRDVDVDTDPPLAPHYPGTDELVEEVRAVHGWQRADFLRDKVSDCLAAGIHYYDVLDRLDDDLIGVGSVKAVLLSRLDELIELHAPSGEAETEHRYSLPPPVPPPHLRAGSRHPLTCRCRGTHLIAVVEDGMTKQAKCPGLYAVGEAS